MLRGGGHRLLTCRCTFLFLQGHETRDPTHVWAAGCPCVSTHPPPLPGSGGRGGGGHALRGNTLTMLQKLPRFHVTIYALGGSPPIVENGSPPPPCLLPPGLSPCTPCLVQSSWGHGNYSRPGVRRLRSQAASATMNWDHELVAFPDFGFQWGCLYAFLILYSEPLSGFSVPKNTLD